MQRERREHGGLRCVGFRGGDSHPRRRASASCAVAGTGNADLLLLRIAAAIMQKSPAEMQQMAVEMGTETMLETVEGFTSSTTGTKPMRRLPSRQ